MDMVAKLASFTLTPPPLPAHFNRHEYSKDLDVLQFFLVSSVLCWICCGEHIRIGAFIAILPQLVRGQYKGNNIPIVSCYEFHRC